MIAKRLLFWCTTILYGRDDECVFIYHAGGARHVDGKRLRLLRIHNKYALRKCCVRLEIAICVHRNRLSRLVQIDGQTRSPDRPGTVLAKDAVAPCHRSTLIDHNLQVNDGQG